MPTAGRRAVAASRSSRPEASAGTRFIRPDDGSAVGFAQASVARTQSEPDALWRHCRNSIRIARLLVHDDGAPQLIETACEMALECACRSLLRVRGMPCDGGLALNLARLSVPRNLVDRVRDEERSLQRLALTERVVAWVAACLGECRPGESWRF